MRDLNDLQFFAAAVGHRSFSREEGDHADRLILIGESQLGRTILVVFTERVASGISKLSAQGEPRSASGAPMSRESKPSKRSLREIPEVDFSKAKRLPRGKYAAKARRSFAIAIVEPELFARFGSSDAVNAALRAVIEAAEAVKHPVKEKRHSRGSKGRPLRSS